MLLRDGNNSLELAPLEQAPYGTQFPGDTKFRVRTKIDCLEGSFSADATTWISEPVLSAFFNQLQLLENKREGSANLESMSPNELNLEIRPYNRAGHMAAIGQVGQWCYANVGDRHWSVVGFAIPFCPSELPKLVQEFRNLLEFGPSRQ